MKTHGECTAKKMLSYYLSTVVIIGSSGAVTYIECSKVLNACYLQ